MSDVVSNRTEPKIDSDVECVFKSRALVGEGPVWNCKRQVLHWVDVIGPHIHTFIPEEKTLSSFKLPHIVSAILPAEKDRLIAITEKGIGFLNENSGDLDFISNPESALPENRFNDAKTDSEGRIWAGSMNKSVSAPSGSLYRFDTPFSASRMDTGFKVSNGMGWCPKNKTMYFTETVLATIFAYDFDKETGEISKRREFLKFDVENGKPDGMCIDCDGNLWIAFWDGWRVSGYTSKGEHIRDIKIPVPRATSCCFGGKDLKTLYITSASAGLSEEQLQTAPLSGSLFAIDMETAGQPTHEVKL